MLGRAPRPPVLGRVPLRGSGSLDRESLDAMLALWSEIGQGVVLVTGEEGRSELAVGLAAAAAAAGRKGALIECDLATPRLANELGLDPVPGFGEYLAHEAEAPEILQASILAGPGSTLAAAPLVCIVAGAPTALGPVLFASESFDHAIEKLRGAYDIAVLDGPAIDDEDSLRAVAARADRVIFCSGKSRVPRCLRDIVTGVVEPIP